MVKLCTNFKDRGRWIEFNKGVFSASCTAPPAVAAVLNDHMPAAAAGPGPGPTQKCDPFPCRVPPPL